MNTDTLNPHFTDLLRCPITGESLTYLTGTEVSVCNEKIRSALVRDIEGRLVKDPADGLLRNASGTVTYFVRQGVPLLQPHIGLREEARTESSKIECSSAQSRTKMMQEIDFWHGVCVDKPYAHSDRYAYLFERCFRLTPAFFEGKTILDIGCGPMGSLHSRTNAKLRVGLDPLSEGYLQFKNGPREMEYLCAAAENIPVADSSFDIVVSFNSLDHVDNLDPVIEEISRIVTPGGHFILFTEIHKTPTCCEPIAMDWDINKRFESFREIFRFECEKHSNFELLPFNHFDKSDRYGFLFTILQRLV